MAIRYYASLWNERCYPPAHDSLAELGERCRAAELGLELWPYALSLDPYRVAHPRDPAIGYDRQHVANEVLEICTAEHRSAMVVALSGVETVWHSRFRRDPGVPLPRYLSPGQHREQIDTAAAMGSRSIAVHELSEEVTTASVTDDPFGIVEHILAYATARGVDIAFEAWRMDVTDNACRQYPQLQVCLDPAALAVHDPGAHLEALLARVGDRVCSVHAYEHEHLPPGTDPDVRPTWLTLVRFLDSREPEVPLIFEFGPVPGDPVAAPGRPQPSDAIEAVERAREYVEAVRRG